MSIQPVSTTEASQHTNSEPPLRPTTPRIPDSLGPHPESVRPAPSGNNARSPLGVVCDFLTCINFFILSTFHKIQRFFCPCLSKATHSAPVAPRSVILPPTPRMPPPLQDPAASSLPLRSSIADAEEAEDRAFQALALSEDDRENIAFLVNTLATAVFLPTEDLKRRGDAIRHVHPFVFWKYILTQENLAAQMKAIKPKFFGIIWGQFSAGCIEKLEAMDDASLLAPHVNAFARSIRRDPRELRDLMNVSWIDFLNSLIDSSPEALPRRTREVNPIRLDRDSGSAATTASDSTASRGSSVILPIGDHPAASTGLFNTPRSGEIQATGMALSPERASPSMRIDSIFMTVVQKQKLTRLLTDISQNSPILLGLQVAFLRNDWQALQDVHPLRLLHEVFTNPSHTAKLDLILKSNLKRTYFLDDFAYTLKTGASRALDLSSYFDDFKRQMRIEDYPLESLRGGGNHEWRLLIKHLHNIKTAAAVESTFSG